MNQEERSNRIFFKLIKRKCAFLAGLLVFASIFLPLISFSQDRPNHGVIPLQLGNPPVSDEQLANQLYQARDFEKAVEVYKKLYEQKPTQYYYSFYLFCLLELREYDKARRLIRDQQKNDVDDLKYMVDQGYVLFREGSQEKSRKIYDEALRKLTPNQQQIFELANAFISRAENDYAIKTYLKGRELLNYSYPFAFELASIYERTNNIPGAIDAYLDLIEINSSYINTIEDRLQNLLAGDIDDERNDILRKKLLERGQKNPDKTQFSELLWWYSVQQKDFSLALIQAKALDIRLKENGDRVFQVSGLAESNGDYDQALEALKYLIKKGPSSPYYPLARMEEINVLYRKAVENPDRTEKQLTELESRMLAELKLWENDARSVPLIRNLAHLEAFWLEKTDEAIRLLEEAKDMPGINLSERSECKIELADILLFNGEVWEATLLYQQVYMDFKNDALGQTAKFKNAQLSYYIGEFGWAKAQADILKAATSKMIANDAMALSLLLNENYDPDSNTVALSLFSRAGLLEYRNRYDEAIRVLDSIPSLFPFYDHPIMDDMIFRKAEIMIKKGKLHDADSLFQEVTDEYPESVLADLALFRRATLYDRMLSEKEKAMALYTELLDKYPGSVFVTDARIRFRQLRGDKIQ